VKGDEAVVLVCAVDSVILFDVRNPEDSTDDIIFDESTVSSRTEWVVRKTGRGWVRSSGETAAEVVGEGLCDA
jgi:hypothetical protein